MDSPPAPVPHRFRSVVQRTYQALQSVFARLSLAVVFAIASLLVFVKVAHEVHESETLRWDRSILTFFHAHQWPPLHVALRLVSELAGPRCQSAIVILALLFFAWRRRFFPDGVALLFASIGGALLMMGLKRLFHRPRPEVIFDDLGFSFPSGHSFFAVIVYGMLAYWLARALPPPPPRPRLHPRLPRYPPRRVQPRFPRRTFPLRRDRRFRRRCPLALGLPRPPPVPPPPPATLMSAVPPAGNLCGCIAPTFRWTL